MKQKICKFVEWAAPFLLLIAGMFLFAIWMECNLAIAVDFEIVDDYLTSIDPNVPSGLNWIFTLGLITIGYIIPFECMDFLFCGVHQIIERYFKKNEKMDKIETETE